MKPNPRLTALLLAVIVLPVVAQDSPFEAGQWTLRFDMGGTIPEDAKLNQFSGPITQGGELELNPGAAFAFAAGYRITPWLTLEGEFGMAYNHVDSVGNWSYPDSGLSHLLLMANVVVEHPIGRFSPFAGAGVGGDWSFLSFGNNNYYYWYAEPDGEGSDFVLSYQLFAGLKYRLSNNASLGVMYRYVGTAEQKWDVDWWNGPDFTIGVESVRMHVISLVFSASF